MDTAKGFRGVWGAIFGVFLLFGPSGPLTAAPYSGGDGTSEAPYLLSTAADLATLAITQADWDKWFVLTADLDLQATPMTIPIGNRVRPFTGVFDGAGHRIVDLTINDTSSSSKPLGLFGVVGTLGLIERVRLIAPSVQSNGDMHAGALAGELNAGATVQQCSVEGGSVSTPNSAAAGGLIGSNSGTVRECYSSADVTAYGLAGGLLGRSTYLVENCMAAGAVTTLKVGTGTASGGLVGAEVDGTIRFCFANSSRISGSRVAGLIGYCSPGSVLSNCVSNKAAPKAVENWPADVVGLAWCEEASVLASRDFFAGLGWDFQTIWSMDSGGLRLQWMPGGPATTPVPGPVAVIKEPTGPIVCDPVTGLATIVLDGTPSTGAGQGALTYAWRCLTAGGGPTTITIDPVVSPTVLLPAGTYRIELVVSAGLVVSLPATITITASAGAATNVPTAVIEGPTGLVRPDPVTGLASIALDGSQSSDPGKKPLQYLWRCLTMDGKPTGIAISPVVNPFLRLAVGTYRIELVVNNGTVDSAPVFLIVTVGGTTGPLTALITGPSGIVRPDPATGLAQVSLDGSRSTGADQKTMRYNWKCLTADGQPTSYTIDSVANPLVLLRVGTYRIELTVSDGTASSAPATASVTINTAPTARVVGPYEAFDEGTGGQQVKLDGSKSFDPDTAHGQALVFSWTCATATTDTASGPTPSMTFPLGLHTVQLVVSDGVESAQTTVLVVVKSAIKAVRTAASPSAVGRTSQVAEVKFYLLLPAGKGIQDVDVQVPMEVEINATKAPLLRDTTHNHKKQTVVVYVARKKVLDLAGTANGLKTATVTVRLKTGELVTGTVNLEVVAGIGPSAAVLLAERSYYYLDTQTWR